MVVNQYNCCGINNEELCMESCDNVYCDLHIGQKNIAKNYIKSISLLYEKLDNLIKVNPKNKNEIDSICYQLKKIVDCNSKIARKNSVKNKYAEFYFKYRDAINTFANYAKQNDFEDEDEDEDYKDDDDNLSQSESESELIQFAMNDMYQRYLNADSDSDRDHNSDSDHDSHSDN